MHDVAVSYDGGPPALAGVDLRLDAGSFHYVLGGSGAGKTTLLSLMSLGLRPTSGRLSLFGEDVATVPRRALPAVRRRIGVVFQDFRLLPNLTALENVSLPLRIAGAPDSAVHDHAAELLRWVGLGASLDALPETLSGGEQQRIAIARAVVGRPRLLVADEPTGSVDDEIAWRLMRLFEELNRLGTAIVMATHNLALVRRFDYPVLRLERGSLLPASRPEPMPDPQTEESAG